MRERPLDSLFNITGRRVDFTKNLPLAWGIEIDVPIDEVQREIVYRRRGISLPKRIISLKYLSLDPQSSLEEEYRNIGKDGGWDHTTLDDLVVEGKFTAKSEAIRRKTIGDLFFEIFGNNTKEKDAFNDILLNGSGDTFVIVEGHGWEVPWRIGERESNEPHDRKTGKLQKVGNNVSVWKILKNYNNPEKFAAIAILACYCGKTKVKIMDVPVVYPVGELYGWRSEMGLLPVIVLSPKNLKA